MHEWIDAIKLQSAGHWMATGQPRHGIVTSVDAINHCVKVTLEPDGIVTGWIPDGVLAAGGLRIACPSEVGSQVVVVSVEGDPEHPVVIAKLFDTDKVPPISPATSQPVQPGEVGIFTDSGSYVHITRQGTYFGGDVHVTGAIHATGDISSGSVSLKTHLHTAVQGGVGVSGPPKE